MVSPDGPSKPELVIVGEAPGVEEEQHGLGFVGVSGEVLWTMLLYVGMGIDRSQCWVSNLHKEMVDPAEVWHKDRARHDAAVSELRDELRAIDCPVIATLGTWSTRALLDVPRLSMYWAHGKSFEWEGRTVIPCYHPAAGFYEPNAFALTQWDLERVEDALAGRPSIIRPGKPRQETAADTEGVPDRPYCATTARRDRGGRIQTHFWSKRSTFRSQIGVLHGAAWDIRMLRCWGRELTSVHDTMVLAHVLQTEPLGLKDLTRRYVGWEDVVEYEDLVVPHLYERAIEVDEKKAKAALRLKRGRIERLEAIAGPPDYDEIEGFREYALSDAEHTLLVWEALAERAQHEGIHV